MKPVLCVISACFVLSFASGSVLAYSGSECEVNDCSKPGPAKSSTTTNKGQAKTKAEAKAEVKGEAKTQAKSKALESAPSPLRDAVGLFK